MAKDDAADDFGYEKARFKIGKNVLLKSPKDYNLLPMQDYKFTKATRSQLSNKQYDYVRNCWILTGRDDNGRLTERAITQEQYEEEMAQEQKKIQGDEDSGIGGLNYSVPDTSSLQKRLNDAYKDQLISEHEQLMEEEEKQDQGKGKKAKRVRPNGVICCCGSPGCTIGPMQEIKGGEQDV